MIVSFARSHFESPKIDTQLSFLFFPSTSNGVGQRWGDANPSKKVHTVDVQQNPNLGDNNSVLCPIDLQSLLDQKVPKTNSKARSPLKIGRGPQKESNLPTKIFLGG